jgi:hypothetical protein
MRLKEMKISSPLKDGIYEVSFGFHSKLDGYATLRLDIPELYAIIFRGYTVEMGQFYSINGCQIYKKSS